MRAAAAAALATALWCGTAEAAIKTYDFTLTVDSIPTSIFGVTSLADGPFHGSFSIDAPLAPSQGFQNLVFTAFSVTVGTESWGLADVLNAYAETDAIGDLTLSKLNISAQHFDGTQQEVFGLVLGYAQNGSWYVADYPQFGGFCGFDTTPPYGGPIFGSCLGGGAANVTIVERPAVPVPGSLALLATALACPSLLRLRRRSPS